MSAIILMKRENRFPPCSASSLASSLETWRTPWSSTMCWKTWSTSPGPTMIWNMPPAAKVPLSSSLSSSACWSILSGSAITSLSRVAQWAAALMFDGPPIASTTSVATLA